MIEFYFHVEDARGILGTGIWPYYIGGAVKYGSWIEINDRHIDALFRDYASIFYIPLIPMSLAAGVFTDKQSVDLLMFSFHRAYRRLPLSKGNADRLVKYVSEKPEHNIRDYDQRYKVAVLVRKSWFVAFCIAVIGGIIGWVLFDLFTLPKLAGVFLGCGLFNRLFIKILKQDQSM